MSGEPSAAVGLVRDFVNTAEPQRGTDQLMPETAEETLDHLGLVAAGAHLDEPGLALVTAVREGLRGLLLGHTDHDLPASELTALDDVLRTVPLTISVPGGVPVLNAVAGEPAHHIVAAILTAVVATPTEEWMRLKVCARASCRWAFFDSSRNRSGRWCSMAGCGNIVKMRRAYRARAAALREPDTDPQADWPTP